jgi:fructokinase
VLEAHYLALALVNFITTLSPERIVLGGGVMEQPHLHKSVREKVLVLLSGYIQVPALLEAVEAYIVPPALGGRAGVLGAVALAQAEQSAMGQEAAENSKTRRPG